MRSAGIRAIPTLAVLRDGVLLALQPGMVPAAGLDELVKKVRALDMAEVQRALQLLSRRHPPPLEVRDVPPHQLRVVWASDLCRLRGARGPGFGGRADR
jgi:hypothetical protein